MDGLDLRDQLVPDGATGETEHRNGFPSAGVDLVSSHLGERRDGCLDGLSGIRGVDVGLAGLAAKPAQRGVTLGIGGLDALARVLPPLVPVFLLVWLENPDNTSLAYVVYEWELFVGR